MNCSQISGKIEIPQFEAQSNIGPVGNIACDGDDALDDLDKGHMVEPSVRHILCSLSAFVLRTAVVIGCEKYIEL